MPRKKRLSLCLPEGVRQASRRMRNEFLLACGHEHLFRNLLHDKLLGRERIERLRLMLRKTIACCCSGFHGCTPRMKFFFDLSAETQRGKTQTSDESD